MERPVICDDRFVRRPPYDNGPFVERVLRWLEAQGFDGTPRFVGVDDDGHELVTFIPGDVPDAEAELSDAQIASLGRLLRRTHDALAGAELADGAELVRHGDAGPHNVVFRGDEAVALIDWEEAAPGDRISDVADVAWCLLDGRWEHGSPDAVAHRIGVFCRGYGWEHVPAVIAAVVTQVEAARAEHLDLGAAQSVAHFDRLLRWLAEHRERLQSA